ncbi:MAG TPA: phosphoribosylformylglycinamidine synthase subunit PurS [Ktedonobacterales bacterium]|nr:phosphoribosylformylglycinamidine synthase subunit PurS [Ktedonobacterales bacterium]
MNFRADIEVMLKAGVFDPQGAAIVKALGALGFDEVEDARAGKQIALRLTAPDEATARERVSAMCERLLANTVIERYSFTLAEDTEEQERQSA